VSGLRGTLAGMYREDIIVRAADAVLKHSGDDAVFAAACKGLDGADRGAAEFFAASLIFMREELGEAAVRQVRARHARRAA